jgi:hypothetical protein
MTQPRPPKRKPIHRGCMFTYITYNNSVCTSHRRVCTLLPYCHIEVLTAHGYKSAHNLDTTKLRCFMITTPHLYLHLNWWLVNVYYGSHHTTSNNAPILGSSPVTSLPAHNPLQQSAALNDYTYTLFTLHSYYSSTI